MRTFYQKIIKSFTIKRSLFIILLILNYNVYAQLNEFMVQWYFSEGEKNETNTAPWRKSDPYPQTFFNDMKDKYHFNCVFFETDSQPTGSEYGFFKMAKNAGLKSILIQKELTSRRDIISTSSFNEANANSTIDKFSSSDFDVIGYLVSDKPLTLSTCNITSSNNECNNLIEYIPEFTNFIYKKNDSLIRYAKLFPFYNTDIFYRESYIQKYFNTSNPNLFAFDQYPIFDPSLSFFTSLYDFGMKSVENSIPFIYGLTPFKNKSNYLDSVPQPSDYGINVKSKSEFNYEIYAALAYGAKGISYWPGFQWVRNDAFHQFALKDDDKVYDYLATLHEKLIKNSNILLHLNFASAYHVNVTSTTYLGNNNEQIHEFCKWSNFAKDNFAKQIFSDLNYPVIDSISNSVPQELAITFLTDSTNQIYFWLFNKSLERKMTLSLNLNNPSKDLLNGQYINSNFKIVHLEPGEAKLFTATSSPSNQITTNICDFVYDTSSNMGFYPFETASNINIGNIGSSYSVKVDSLVTKSFMAQHIDLKNTKICTGSNVRLKAYKDCNYSNQQRPTQVFDSNYKIIFVSSIDKCSDKNWLNQIKQKWGATGVSLKLLWAEICPDGPESFNWDKADLAISNIIDAGLDVYIRVIMGQQKPDWVQPGSYDLTVDDFHTLHDGSLLNIDYWRLYTLNIGSSKSSNYLLNFYKNVLNHISINYPASLNIIKEVVPSISPDAEMEFPGYRMCGYSNPEIEKFKKYLQDKYINISNLNANWGSSFNNFDSINPKAFNWDSVGISYSYPIGRMDWINWKTSLLKCFVDSCAELTHAKYYKMGLQIGSIYDANLPRRGFYEITPLLENVDALRIADIIEYKPNFDFGADYARSACKYWGIIKNKKINFSTETNWPNYNNHLDSTLCQDWSAQLQAYYKKGADAAYIVCWDLTDIADFENKYKIWKNTLNSLSNKGSINVNYSKAVYLGCEENIYENTNPIINRVYSKGDSVDYQTQFMLYSVTPHNNYINNPYNYDGQCDIVTNFMISNSPNYIQNNYQLLCLTQSSKYISNQAYLNLLRNDLNIRIINGTHYNDNGQGKYAIMPGLYNEYNQQRCPIPLIWRSRPDDLMLLFPTGNYPDNNYALTHNWSAGNNFDLLYWAENYGKNEYPNLNVKDTYNLFSYDSNIRKVWNSRSDLQQFFPDGHYTSSHSQNMIEWARVYGCNENSEELCSYKYWPYIGTPSVCNRAAKASTDKRNYENQDILGLENVEFVYPNPTRNDFILNINIGKDDKIDVNVIDCLGKIVKTLQVTQEKTRISLQDCADGIYMISFFKGKKSYQFKVIKQN